MRGIRQSEKAASFVLAQKEVPVLGTTSKSYWKGPQRSPIHIPHHREDGKELKTRIRPRLVSSSRQQPKAPASQATIAPSSMQNSINAFGTKVTICMANPRRLYATYSGVWAPCYTWLCKACWDPISYSWTDQKKMEEEATLALELEFCHRSQRSPHMSLVLPVDAASATSRLLSLSPFSPPSISELLCTITLQALSAVQT